MPGRCCEYFTPGSEGARMAQHDDRCMKLAMAGVIALGSVALQATFSTPASAAAPPGGDRHLVSRGTSTPTGSTSTVRHGGLFTGAQEAGEAAGDGGTGPNRSKSTRGGRHVAGTTSLPVDATTPRL